MNFLFLFTRFSVTYKDLYKDVYNLTEISLPPTSVNKVAGEVPNSQAPHLSQNSESPCFPSV